MNLFCLTFFVFPLWVLATDQGSQAATPAIHWFDCKQNGSIALTCGTLSVPLDYTEAASNETLDLQLVRVNATKQPSKGSILFNPGGPGEIGRSFLTNKAGIGSSALLMTGGEYDLIAFDPRGTGETIPFNCYPATLVGQVQRLTASIEIPLAITESNTALGSVWAGKEILAEVCLQNAKRIGELIGTAFVARDMMQIVDALNEDGLLRYWGFSYGTALGTAVAAMFPDRMDKIVLDGVLNPTQYWSGLSVQQLTDSDATYDAFFTGCLQNPQYCALAHYNSTAKELQTTVETLLEEVKYQPIVLGSNISTDLVTYQSLRLLIASAIYATSLWPDLAQAFDAVFTRNQTSYVEASTVLTGALGARLYPQYAGPENLQGIRCSDSAFRTDEFSEILPVVEELLNKSQVLGDVQASNVIVPCARWKMRAKERYTGGFNDIKTKNPILFVANTFDPYTPLVSARNASAAFDGSVVLQHDGHGHTSTSQPSLCTAKVIRAYFVNGTLPKEGTICPSSEPTFASPNSTLLSAVAPLANGGKRSLSVAEVDDAALLAATKHLRKAMTFRRLLL